MSKFNNEQERKDFIDKLKEVISEELKVKIKPVITDHAYYISYEVSFEELSIVKEEMFISYNV